MNANPRFEPHYRAVVVGGGQAGLCASHFLSEAGIDHVVFEKKTIMHKWREERWDAFCLVTPNWQCQLPGHPYDGPEPRGFMVKHEILDYLDGFAPQAQAARARACRGAGHREAGRALPRSHFERRLHRRRLFFSQPASTAIRAGRALRNGFPNRSCRSTRPSIAIRRSCLRGSVMVVGSGQSGAQIAEDLHLAGRKVHLVTGNAPRCARFYRGRDVVDWLWDIGQYAITVADDGMGHKRHDTNHYLTGRDGGRDIDLRAFAREGMSLYGRLKGVESGRMLFEPNLRTNLDEADRVYNGINALIDRHIAEKGLAAPEGGPYVPVWEPADEPAELDLSAAGVSAVIWATGFAPDWSYARLPIFDGTGYPVNRRGVTSVPGAYVLGLPWLWTWGSGRFLSVGRDAEHVVRHEVQRRVTVGVDR